MKLNKSRIGQCIFLTVICGILCLMMVHITYTKHNLEELKSQLEDKELKRRLQGEIYEKTSGMTSQGVHVWSAYLFAIPYLIFDIPLILVYIVKYHT